MARIEKEVHKNRRRLGKKRYFSALLAASLLIPSVLMPGKNTVEGAGHANIVKVGYYEDSSAARAYLDLSDGRTVFLNNSMMQSSNELEDYGTDYVKYLKFDTAEKGAAFRLTKNGEFFVRQEESKDSTRTFNKLADGWTDFVYLKINSKWSYFGLTSSGNVMAMGGGTSGQLGTGIKQDTTFEMEVLDPDLADTPLTGVRKMIQVSPNVVLFVTDTDVYVLGSTFLGASSHINAKPVKITDKFPGFSGASTFDMGYLADGTFGSFFTSKGTAHPTMRYFHVNGSYYTLTNTNEFSQYTYNGGSYYDETQNSQLYHFNGDPTKTVRSLHLLKTNDLGSQIYYAENTYYELHSNGDLVAWGLPVNKISASTSYPSPGNYSTTKETIMSNVTKVAANGDPKINIVAGLGTNGYVYVLGNNGVNYQNITGILGPITTPTRLLGSDGQVKNITDIAFSDSSLYALKDSGDVYVFSSSGGRNTYSKTSGNKYVGLLEVRFNHTKRNVYGLDDVGNLHLLGPDGSSVPQTGATGIYPPGYTPAPTTIDKPTDSLSTDKFENTIVTLNYPPTANKKEYSLDNGVTWLEYTAPITLTTAGQTKVLARAGLDTLYSDVLEVSVMNNPIVIPAGYPKLLEQDGVLTVDTGSIDIRRVKVQIDIDGQVSDYTSPVLLQEGDYVATAIILNQNGEELTRVTENITVDPPAPGTLTAPVGTVGDLNANNQRPLTIGFNPTQGSLQIQHDGGPWVDEPEILNQYNGTSENPTATERKYTLFVDNVVDSVYKARVTDGVNFSSETLLVVTAQVYDPSFFRDIDDKLLIDFSNLPTGNWYKEYSVDQGSTYHEYTGPIDIGAALPIKVRVTDTGSGQVLIDKEYITPALNGTNPNPNPNPGVDPSWGTEVTAADQEAILNVIGGGLSSKFNGLLLENIEIQTVNQYQTINSVTNTLIEDSSGSGDGWTYSLSITDFVSDPVLDTGLGTQDLVVKIPSSAMNVDVKSAKVLAGSPDQTAKVGNYVLGNQKQALAQANPFEGMGYYDIPMDFMFRVPSTVEVVSMGSGSAHQVGDKVGLRVGVYRSLFTFSLAKGI